MDKIASFLSSKTIWGVITTVLAFALPLIFKRELDPNDKTIITETLQTIGVGIGSLLTIYGRMKAQGPLVPPSN
jgi:hypothetical protein